MPDYNIYLHVKEEGIGAHTDINENQGKNTKVNFGNNKIVKGLNVASSFVSNPDSLIGMAKGSAVGAAGIVGAVLVAAYKLADSITTKATSLTAVITGDSQGLRNWQSYKKTVNIYTHPISSIISYETARINMERQNQRNLMQLQMLGDSQVNQNYGRKV